MNYSDPNTQLLNLTDRCVMCGLCSTHCPTYKLSQIENESPRGRIALIRAAASGSLPINKAANDHLSHCLGCRQCETSCPSDVPYQQIFQLGKAIFKQALGDTAPPASARLATQQSQGKLVRLYQKTRLAKPVARSGILGKTGLARLNARLPSPYQSRFRSKKPALSAKSSVTVFEGCTGKQLDRSTIDATRFVLQQLGYQTITPNQQGCCGSLALNRGDSALATEQISANIRAFNDHQATHIVFSASGCGALLKRYGEWADQFSPLTSTPTDIASLVTETDDWKKLQPRALNKRAVFHSTCSSRFAHSNRNASLEMLGQIPALQLQILDAGFGCCGAGGEHQLAQPELADKVREPLLDQLTELQPELLVTENIGCAVHLQAGLYERGLDIQVVHPIVLFASQISE